MVLAHKDYKSTLKAGVIIWSLFVFIFTQTFAFPLQVFAAVVEPVDIAEAENEAKSAKDLVVLVVDKKLSEDSNDYFGISNEYEELGEITIEQRIQRYAEDVTLNNSFTDVKLIYFDEAVDSVESLALALENLYLNNFMTGVVLIGDVPLPVVNKNGNRYVSLFPYTDFVDKAYIFRNGEFVKNEAVGLPRAEIWHGVISGNSKEDIAKFFDKNHIYYLGKKKFEKNGDYGIYGKYARFDQKIFFGDLVNAEKQMHPDIYKRYLDYLDAAEDLTYMRFNKHWANQFMQKAAAEITSIDPESEIYPDDDSFLSNLGNIDLKGIPDIQSRTIILQNLVPYYKIFNKYISSLNDWADYTGRYTASQVDSVPALISKKDDATRLYLKEVNDALEKQINKIAEKIEEPIPLLESVKLTGEYRNAGGQSENFRVMARFLNNPDGEIDTPVFFQVLRFHYKNEKDDQFYINGVKVSELPEVKEDVLQSAKICAPYLGSTKSSYFEPETLDFNPEGGKISILTRSLRSDNIKTAIPTVTAGVNTRVISKAELREKTGLLPGISAEGEEETGVIIEGNPTYGISSFIHNTVGGNDEYAGPFERNLEKGDIITKINGKRLSYAFTFDDAVSETYKSAEKVFDIVNDGERNLINNFRYNIAVRGPQPPVDPNNPNAPRPHPIEFLENIDQIRSSQLLRNKEIKVIASFLDIEFYRNGVKQPNLRVSFSVEGDDSQEELDKRWPVKKKPEGDVQIVMYPKSMQAPAAFDSATDGALFMLYQNDDKGYGGDAYDASGGCNYASASKNSDRCLGRLAATPVLDPAGSQAPIKVNVPGEGLQLEFPRNVKKENNQNSQRAEDYENSVDEFKFPESYSFEQIDEYYLDSCFGEPLPTSPFGLERDANPYRFPLDPSTKGNDGFIYNTDFYGLLLRSIGRFMESNLSDEDDYIHNNRDTNFSPRDGLWLGMADLSADQIKLDDGVTLADFAIRYGLFNGLDDNNNGIADFIWEDKNGDGIAETKTWDLLEADPRFGISADNLPEIARKMLSHETTYVIPYSDPQFPADLRGNRRRDLVLKVEPSQYENKKLSTVILHNEPTKHTIAEQLKTHATLDLPIDNPRYVAFMAEPQIPRSQRYPNPNPAEGVNAQAIIQNLNIQPHYYPGKIQKVNYINLFDDDIETIEDLREELVEKASELAQIPGSYKLMENGNSNINAIRDEILTTYLAPTVTSLLNDPISGFNLNRASTLQLEDALVWKNLNIDEKHQYILEYYLNGQKNAFIDDSTLFPVPLGQSAGYGYEASYLVLDGKEDYFEMAFNKDLPEEDDPRFSPLRTSVENRPEEIEEEVSAKKDDDWEFVWLDQFLKELEEFIEGFTTIPNFTQACGFNAALDELLNGQKGPTKIESLILEVDKNVAFVNGDEIVITGKAFDANGNSIRKNNDLIKLLFEQNDEAFVLNGSHEQVLDNKGEIKFTLRTNNILGSANLTLQTNQGIKSNTIQVSTTKKHLKIFGEKILTADDESITDIEVRVYGDDGEIISDEVNVKLGLNNQLVSIVGQDLVLTQSGVARFKIKAGRRTGKAGMKFEVVGGSYPAKSEELLLEAGEPVRIGIDSDSFVLVANNQSKTTLNVSLRDKFGNIANNSFTKVAVFANDLAEVDQSGDIDSKIVGVQLNTSEGRTSIDVLAKDQTGEANLIFVLFDYDLEEKFIEVGDRWQEIDFENRVGASVTIEVLPEVDIELTALDENLQELGNVVADGKSLVKLGAKLKYGDQIVNYNGQIKFKVVDESLGKIVNPAKKNDQWTDTCCKCFTSISRLHKF